MSTLVGVLVIVALALVLYGASKGEDHSVRVQRNKPGQQQ